MGEIQAQRKAGVSENEKLKIDIISKKLLKVFDCNKNGKLEYQEAISAFCVLCRGSIQSKIMYQMMAYSEVINESKRKRDGSFSNEDLGIRLKNLKKFMLCVFRLAL